MKNLLPDFFQTLLKGKDLKSSIFKGSLGSFFIQFGNAILGFLLGVVLARLLGAESYGNYVYVYALISTLAMPTQLGLPNLLVRFVAQYQANEEWGKLKGLIKWSNWAVFVLSITMIGGTYFVLRVLSLTTERLSTLHWGLLLLPIIALGALRGAALRGLRYVVLGKLPDKILRQAFLVIMVLGYFYFFNRSIYADNAMMLHVISALVVFLIGTFWLWQKLPSKVFSSDTEYLSRKWISIAIPFLLTGGMFVLNNKVDILMLGWFKSSENVGVYEITVKASSLVAFSLLAMNAVLAPYFSKFYTEGKNKVLKKIATWGVFISLGVSVPVAIFLSSFGYEILSFFFGAEFATGHVTLILLCIGQLINVGAGSIGLLLNMTGYEKLVLKGVAISTVLNIILNLFLIPNHGMEGAALATIVTFFIWNFILVYWGIKYLNVNTSIFSLKILFD
ncbi:flippase [Fodinibius sp. Rm-B-1B1-1]|uniref:flippase n=1 Tax=Fodinibius alkaliphilus TaxID=3140241 RepID=UPI003159D8BA